MALAWHEKASRTALQTSLVFLTHTLLVQTHTHDVSDPWLSLIKKEVKVLFVWNTSVNAKDTQNYEEKHQE